MSSKFGRFAFGRGPYSRDPIQVQIGSSSWVAFSGRAIVTGTVAMFSSSSVDATGRLLWDRIPIPPCEIWPPLPPDPPDWDDIAVAPPAWPPIAPDAPAWEAIAVPPPSPWAPLVANPCCRVAA